MSETKDLSLVLNTIQHRDFQEVLRKTLPKGVTQERFTQATVAALRHQPDVFVECDRNSIYNAIVLAAKDGLMPDGRHGALVPYKGKDGTRRCQFLIMPEGIIDKLAGIGITCYAASVYAGEKVRIWNDDTGQHLEHEPTTFGTRGDRMGAYAVARILGTGVTYVEAMNMEDIEKVRRSSRSRDKNGNLVGPWADWPDRMEQKSCLHRVCKRLPNVSLPDDDEYVDKTAVTIDTTPVATAPAAKTNGRPAALQKVVDSDKAAPISTEPPPSDEPPPPQDETF